MDNLSLDKPDPFSGLMAFAAVAETGGFNSAARRLKLTPSAISKAISRLEEELGVTLFRRTTRSVALSDEGRNMFEQVRPLISAAEEAKASVNSARFSPRGKVRISVPVSFGQFVLAPRLDTFYNQYPNLILELVLTDRYPDLIEERFDLAVVLGPVPDSRLVARPLSRHRFLTVASPKYVVTQGQPAQPSELSRYSCLSYLMAASGAPKPWHFENEFGAQSITPFGPIISDHATVLLDAVKQSLGFAHMPEYVVANSLAEGRLLSVLNNFQSFGPPLSVVYPRSSTTPFRVKAAIQFLLSMEELRYSSIDL